MSVSSKKKIGLILTGGGARGAYQAGVLQGVSEITAKVGVEKPFSSISGVSVGAINAALIASYAEDMRLACLRLVDIWKRLKTTDVIHTGKVAVGKKAARMILEVTSGKMIKEKKARSLLNNEPLFGFLKKVINFSQIHKNIKEGHLESLAITAVNYADGKNYIFFETNQKVEPWIREKRVVVEAQITLEHLLASSAIPLYFPPQKIGDDYYADGNIRNSTPLSPPIKLGAEKLLVIPVKEKEALTGEKESYTPTLGRMISVLLNALLLDAVDFDYERLSRINNTLKLVPGEGSTELKNIDVCMIRPSEDIEEIAYKYVDLIPGALKYYLEGLGSARESGGLISTLLFESSFTESLIELGYKDAMNMKDEVEYFFTQ